MSERERRRWLFVYSVEKNLSTRKISEKKKQIVGLSALKQRENILEIAWEERVKLKLSNNLT